MSETQTVARGSFARWLPALAALCFLAGFADLVRGGITLGPVLLIAGYCVAAPAAILGGRVPG